MVRNVRFRRRSRSSRRRAVFSGTAAAVQNGPLVPLESYPRVSRWGGRGRVLRAV